MRLSLEEMLQYLRNRTKVTDDDPSLVQELNTGMDWAWQRLYLTNPSVMLTFNTAGTFAVNTQEFDLEAEIVAAGGSLAGIKTFWIKGTNDQYFIPAIWMDSNDPQYLAQDQLQPAQVIQPVFYTIYNSNQIRFSPELPSGTQWRVDWEGTPPKLSLNSNCQTTLPEELQVPIVDHATGTIFLNIDDTRSDRWFQVAETHLITAMHKIKRKQFATPFTTKPYPNYGYGNNFAGPTSS